MVFVNRLRFGWPYGLSHLAFSLGVAGMVAVLVFGLWYPFPYRELAGGRELFWIIISVDVVCGPLLTLILAAPQKSRRQLLTDIGMVAVLQLLALGYGMYVLAGARPVALAFEVDRFRVVTAADIEPSDLEQAPAHFRALSYTGPRLVGLRAPKNSDEQYDSISLGLAGVEPSMRPNWWTEYPQALPAVLAVAKPLAILRAKHPSQLAVIDAALEKAQTADKELLWLPLVSRNTSSWVVLIDKTKGLPRAYLPLDGF